LRDANDTKFGVYIQFLTVNIEIIYFKLKVDLVQSGDPFTKGVKNSWKEALFERDTKRESAHSSIIANYFDEDDSQTVNFNHQIVVNH